MSQLFIKTMSVWVSSVVSQVSQSDGQSVSHWMVYLVVYMLHVDGCFCFAQIAIG